MLQYSHRNFFQRYSEAIINILKRIMEINKIRITKIKLLEMIVSIKIYIGTIVMGIFGFMKSAFHG